jgi:hypothetical protein
MTPKSHIVVLIAVFLAACASVGSDAEVNRIASSTTKLARMLEAYVYENGDGRNFTSDELAEEMEREDPQLVKLLEKYDLRFRAEGENSSVLVCRKEKDEAVVEDAGCSAKSDMPWDEPHSCEFTLDLEAICSGPN